MRRVRSVIGMPGRPKIVSMPLSFSASMTSVKPSVSCAAACGVVGAGGRGRLRRFGGYVVHVSFSDRGRRRPQRHGVAALRREREAPVAGRDDAAILQKSALGLLGFF